ncbi:MAG: energy transducer TonB [Pseudarcicella sp.]|nr:energy transducer TonB [Pseudarcicella sp.]
MTIKKIVLLIISFAFSEACYSQKSINCDSLYLSDSINAKELFIQYHELPTLLTDISSICNCQGKGRVVVKLVVDTLGASNCVKVVSSNNQNLSDVALDCAKNLTFKPVNNNGKKVVRICYIPIVFKE